MQEQKTFRVGLVGCGGIAQVHAQALSQLPGCELIAVCDVRPERARALADETGARPYGSFGEMLEGEALDSVHLCTPHALHVPHAVEALGRGIHVLSEKPAAATLQQLAALRRAVEASRAAYGVCFQNRYNPASISALEIAREGRYGRLLGSRACVTWRREGAYYTDSGWRGQWALEGGSAMINQAIHTLDLQLLLCGRPVKVQAQMQNMTLKDTIETEDSCQLRMELDGGAVALFYATVGYAYDAPVLLEAAFEKGALRIEGDQLYLQEGQAPWRHVPTEALKAPLGKAYWGAGHLALIADFYAALAAGRPFAVGIGEAEAALGPLLRAYEDWQKSARA